MDRWWEIGINGVDEGLSEGGSRRINAWGGAR